MLRGPSNCRGASLSAPWGAWFEPYLGNCAELLYAERSRELWESTGLR